MRKVDLNEYKRKQAALDGPGLDEFGNPMTPVDEFGNPLIDDETGDPSDLESDSESVEPESELQSEPAAADIPSRL